MLKSLSPNEAIVLGFISEGYTNKEISDRLLTPILIIEGLVQGVYKKLKVRNCFQAAAKYAMSKN